MSHPSEAPVCTLTSVGPYTLLHEIGVGSFGQVRLAKKNNDDALYAIKIISLSRVKDAQLEDQLKREISVLRKLKHRNIVRLIEVLKNKKFIFLITEYIDGGDLFDFIMHRGLLQEHEVRALFKQIIEGVAFCHGNKVVQRDLKVENILLTQEGTVKLADFGFSNIIDTDEYLKTVCGTPSCIAPEILRHEPYTASVDVFSMAVVLFQLCAGRLPFDDESTEGIFEKIMTMDYACPPHFSAHLVDLISKAFVLQGHERISLEEMSKHPWMLTEPLEDTTRPCEGEESKRATSPTRPPEPNETMEKMNTLRVHFR